MIKNKILVILFVFNAVLNFSSCKEEQGKHSMNQGNKYTCSMHPQVINDGPGTCPICKMDLVPMNSTVSQNELSLSESQVQMANIQTIRVDMSNFKTSKVLNGRLVINEQQSELIASRYAGRIEKLYVKETGRLISKGQSLFQIYSEELQTLQQDFLLQLKQVAAFPEEKIYQTLRDAAKNKLRLFGYSESQIKGLSLTGKTEPSMMVYSSASGIVTELNLSEGQYVSQGTQVLRLDNLNKLWLEMDVYPEELGSIRMGMPVRVSFDGTNREEQTLKIDFIAPQMDPSSQIVKIRATIQNPGDLQAGMQARVLLPMSDISNVMSLPLDAVVRDEKGAHVWVKNENNTYSPRMVKTGEEDSERIIILSGLEGVKEVVVSGAYLLSSELILKTGSEEMAGHTM